MSKNYVELLWKLFAVTPTPYERKKLEIIQAAVKVYARDGFEKSNFESVARKCGISRTLMHYYFESREELFEKTVTYVRHHWQQFVIQEIKKAKGSAREELKRYIYSTLDWTYRYPTYYRVQVLFYVFASHKGKMRELNTTIVQTGLGRVVSLIELGNLRKEWAVKDPYQTALRIHVLLTGAALSLNTENKKESYEEISHLVFSQIDLQEKSSTQDKDEGLA